VRTGADRTDVAPVWPTRLIRPPSDSPLLVYLDLNHWIALAKATTGHRDGVRLRPVLDELRAKRDRTTYVIGLPLVMEIAGIRRRRQLRDVAHVIEEFTDFACVLPPHTIAALEFESALAAVAPIVERFNPVPLVGRGVLRAAGLDGRLRIRDRNGSDVTDRARERYTKGAAAFDEFIADGERRLDRSILQGPQDDREEAELRRLGWEPAVARAGAERRAQQEREQAARLAADSRWRRGRLRDVVAARYVALEIEAIRDEALKAHGRRLPEVLPTPDAARRFTDCMPSADVRITLVTSKHRSAASRWLPNDIFDIDALSVAVAYCDIVVTEAHSAHVLRQAGTPHRFGTCVLTTLDDLTEKLDAS
jgi:hypothetical protein